MAEYSRGGLFARSFGIVIASAAVLLGTSANAFAAGDEPQTARYFTINEVMAKRTGQTPNPGTNKSPVQIAALDAPATGNNAAAWPAGVTPQGEEPFGLVTFRAPEGLLWAKWRKLEGELAEEAQVLSQCRADPKNCSNSAAKKYLFLVEQSRGLSGRAKIAWINRTINAAIHYASDQDQYGVPDLWSAPLATFSTGQGDCEDYAIAKYVALRDAGYSSDDLRLLIVRDRIARQDHAVTGVRQDGRWLMLDNRHDILLENKDAGHFMPLFALDQDGVKLFAVPYDKPPTTTPAQVASGTADTAKPVPNIEPASSAEALGLRLNTFEPPPLRGGL